MKLWTLAGSTAVLALLTGTAAWADVTPEEVWQNWQDIAASGGSTLTTGSVARDGDTLIVTDLKTSHDNDGIQSDSRISEIRFADLGDGTVGVTMADELNFTTASAAHGEMPATSSNGTLRVPGLVGTVTGTAEAASYAFAVPSLELLVEPAKDGKPAGTIDIFLTNAKATYLLTGPADAKSLDGSFDAASAAFNLDIVEEETVTGTLNVADIAGKITGNFIGMEEAEISDALAKGLMIDTSLSFGALNYGFDIVAKDGPSNLTGGSEGGSFQMVMNAAQMVLAAAGKNVSVTLISAQLPFPELKLSYAESGFNLTLPLGASDQPKDFAFLTKIIDLQVSDELWGMLDPTGVLPHDPATLVIDTKGTAKMNTDLMAGRDGDSPDGELHSLDVTQLQARFAGADLTGSGAFTFDNSDKETYDGMPLPTGKLDLTLVGGNGLLDKLVAMGLVSNDQAMGARMMIAMFANSGAGTDELTSTLEFKDKHFYANGQQLQ